MEKGTGRKRKENEECEGYRWESVSGPETPEDLSLKTSGLNAVIAHAVRVLHDQRRDRAVSTPSRACPENRSRQAR
jgi:hypothetical protein